MNDRFVEKKQPIPNAACELRHPVGDRVVVQRIASSGATRRSDSRLSRGERQAPPGVSLFSNERDVQRAQRHVAVERNAATAQRASQISEGERVKL